MTEPTLYDLLGIARSASAEDVRRAFHERARTLEREQANPEAAQHLRRLSHAYQILGDPQRRMQYDATLPAATFGRPQPLDIVTLWKRVGELYFQRSQRFSPAIDAVRVAVPLALEEDHTLILGIDHSHGTLMGYLTATVTYNEVRALIAEVFEQMLEYRVIAGTAPQDWESIKAAEDVLRKKRQAALAAERQQQEDPPAASEVPEETPTEPAGDRWEELMENMFRQWSALDHRGFPQSRAHFVLEQVAVLLRLEEASRTAGVAEEVTQRHIARALDRIASLSGIDSGAVALEYLRLRVAHGTS